jgi:two-component sensor histidine kinase/putative methionine-R-sulfoxide reductase with GAF domain
MENIHDIEKKAKFLEVINSFAVQIINCETEAEVLWLVTKHAIAKLDYVDCVVYMLDSDGIHLTQKAAHGPKNPINFNIENPIKLKLGEGICGNVALTGIPEIITNTQTEERYKVDDTIRLSEISVPIISSNQQVIGVIDSEHPELDFYGQIDLEILTTIASMSSSKLQQISYKVELEEHKASLQGTIIEQTQQLKQIIRKLKDTNEELVEKEKEKAILLKEIHHRVKNNLQIVSSLLSLQSSYVENVDDKKSFLDCQNRILSMSAIHEQLYLKDHFGYIDMKSYIEDLCLRLQTSMVHKKEITFCFDVQNLSFDIDTAVPIGLIITELITNSLKHAFTEPDGKIIVHLAFDSTLGNILEIADNGKGFDINTRIDSMGMTIIDTLAEQIEGVLKIQSNKEGTSVRLTFGQP